MPAHPNKPSRDRLYSPPPPEDMDGLFLFAFTPADTRNKEQHYWNKSPAIKPITALAYFFFSSAGCPFFLLRPSICDASHVFVTFYQSTAAARQIHGQFVHFYISGCRRESSHHPSLSPVHARVFLCQQALCFALPPPFGVQNLSWTDFVFARHRHGLQASPCIFQASLCIQSLVCPLGHSLLKVPRTRWRNRVIWPKIDMQVFTSLLHVP